MPNHTDDMSAIALQNGLTVGARAHAVRALGSKACTDTAQLRSMEITAAEEQGSPKAERTGSNLCGFDLCR